MAKAKKVAQRSAQRVAVVTLPDDDEERDDEVSTGAEAMDPEDPDQQEQDALAELRGLGGGKDYRYAVSRVARKPGEESGYCATYSVGDLSLDNIREQFGGGKYRIRVTDAGGHYVTMTTVEIVSLPKPAPTHTPQPAPATDLNGIAQILQAMRPAGGESATDKLLMLVMNNMTEMIKSMGQRKETSLADTIALINATKEKGGGESSVELLLKGLELGRSLGGGDTSGLDVAREGLGVLTTLIEQDRNKAATQPARAPAPLQLPAGANAQPAATTTTAQPTADAGGNAVLMQKLTWLRSQLNVLIHHAIRGKNPELYAEVMLDNLPPFFTLEEITQRLQAPDALSQLAMLDPRVHEHAAWFEEFRDACIDLLTGKDGEEEETPAGDGDAAGQPQ